MVLLARLIGRLDRADPGEGDPVPGPLLPPAILASVLLSAAATQAIGLHAIFGAFVFGVALRRSLSSATADHLASRIRPLTVAVLLPVYFIGPGLHVNLRAIGSGGVATIALILLAACGGKLIGAYVASRLSGLSHRQSAIMGSLMNTRGLIEIVVLQVALSAGILDGRLFSEFVLMAVVTTMMTPLLLSLLMRHRVDVAQEASHSDVLALGAR
jgi:Kef-type K+ transport system membrane component KefB